MYVLEATAETQGERDDDHVWTTEGELVFVPIIGCQNRRCGCDRGFAGTASHRATTTAMVVDDVVGAVQVVGSALGDGSVVAAGDRRPVDRRGAGVGRRDPRRTGGSSPCSRGRARSAPG